MKLLIIQPTGDKYGHFGMYTSRLANSLSERGHQVTVYTNFLDTKKYISNSIKFEIFHVRNNNLKFEKYEKNKLKNPYMYWYSYFRNSFLVTNQALKSLKYGEYDGVYVTDVEFFIATVLLKFYSSYLPPVVMQINASNFSYQEYPGKFYKKLYKKFQTFAFKKILGKEIKAFSILGNWHKDRLKKQLNLNDNFSVNLIEDATSITKKTISKKVARNKININYNGKIFLFLGLLRDDKGLEVLAKAVKILQEKRKDFKVIVAGFPFSYKKEDILRMFHSINNIIFRLSYIKEDHIPYYYFASDCLLLPYNSNYKGSSGPLTKGACTYGLPVIVSNISEMEILTRKHKLGYVFERNNALSLSKKMNDFLGATSIIKSAFKKNANNLAKSYSWPLIAKKYEKLFLKLKK